MEPMKSFTWWQALPWIFTQSVVRPSASLSWPNLTFFLAVPGLQSQFRRSAARCFADQEWSHPAAPFAPSLSLCPRNLFGAIFGESCSI